MSNDPLVLDYKRLRLKHSRFSSSTKLPDVGLIKLIKCNESDKYRSYTTLLDIQSETNEQVRDFELIVYTLGNLINTSTEISHPPYQY